MLFTEPAELVAGVLATTVRVKGQIRLGRVAGQRVFSAVVTRSVRRCVATAQPTTVRE